MIETRGRKQKTEMIEKVKKLKSDGVDINIIADMLNISQPMVRYYLRQEERKVEKKESIATCFFRQPREVQERIAKEIGYNLPPEIITDDVEKTYKKIEKTIKNEDDSNSLLGRCYKFLNGEIAPNLINEFFNEDEILRLQKIKKFVSKSREIIYGIKSVYAINDVLDELKENGIK